MQKHIRQDSCQTVHSNLGGLGAEGETNRRMTFCISVKCEFFNNYPAFVLLLNEKSQNTLRDMVVTNDKNGPGTHRVFPKS